MPCEEEMLRALETLKVGIRAFHATLATTAEEIRRDLAGRQSTWDTRVARVSAELGPLAAGRIDAGRFAALFANHQADDPTAITILEGALAALTALAARGERLSVVDVAAGASLHDDVARALAEIGRAFSAARLVADVRAGRGPATTHDLTPSVLPFSRWTRTERRLGPPLVVHVHGGDLRASALAEFLDGRQKLVLVVEGECAPAPLVRLITPGSFVLQTADGAGLDRLARWDGPGIAAVVPESAATFVHDPGAGPAVYERLAITAIPERIPRKAIAGFSAAQQTEEIELLRSFAAKPAGGADAASAPASGGAANDPAEQLATWLLSQVDLSKIG